MKNHLIATVFAGAIAVASIAHAEGPDLLSAGELEFGEDGVLFIGDSYASRVFAIETQDIAPVENPTQPILFEAIDVAIADRVGASPREIVINDMAVSTASGNLYFSTHVGRSIEPEVLIVRLKRDTNELEVLDLTALESTHIDLPNPTQFAETLQFGASTRTLTITDLTYYRGELFIAGVSNQEFASTLRRTAYPFDGELSVSSVEIYHGAHDRLETRAPIVTSIVHEIDGVPHLVAAYTCTPLVTIPLSELTDGAHVVGNTIAELGFGNAPVDMFTYTNIPLFGGDERLLITNDQRSATSVSLASLVNAPTLDARAIGPVGLDQVFLPLTGSLHTAPLNPRMTVTVRRNVRTGDLNVQTVPTGAFFEKNEAIVEFNFPGQERSQTPSFNPIDYGFEG